jgi:hypothetical protein
MPLMPSMQAMPAAPTAPLPTHPRSQVETDPQVLVETTALLERVQAARAAPTARVTLSALASRVAKARGRVRPGDAMSPFDRMDQCRAALERLDSNGWKRSYHQRLFHEDFLVRFAFITFSTCIESF